jgi:hypothetical protein
MLERVPEILFISPGCGASIRRATRSLRATKPASWGQGPYPPRTIVEVHRLNQDDIFEVEGTFYAPLKK